MRRKSICLVLTDRCNAECKMCCFSCSPQNHNVMDEELMLEVIRQAAKSEEIQQIGFSGGEPFLYYDLLKKGLLYAKESGLTTSVATNGFWGAWPEDVLIKKIIGLQIDHISLSYDAYHREYIEEESFEKAINFCKGAGISVSVSIGETKGDGSANHFYKTLGDFKYLMDFDIYPFLYAGRAKKFPEDLFFRFCDGEDLFCQDNRLLTVMYDGEVFPCCMQPVFETCLSLGNVREAPLSELLKDNPMARVHEVLQNREAFSELGRAAREELEMALPQKCVSPCEVCQAMFDTKEKLHSLMPYIERIHEKLIVNALLGRGGGKLL